MSFKTSTLTSFSAGMWRSVSLIPVPTILDVSAFNGKELS